MDGNGVGAVGLGWLHMTECRVPCGQVVDIEQHLPDDIWIMLQGSSRGVMRSE